MTSAAEARAELRGLIEDLKARRRSVPPGSDEDRRLAAEIEAMHDRIDDVTIAEMDEVIAALIAAVKAIEAVLAAPRSAPADAALERIRERIRILARSLGLPTPAEAAAAEAGSAQPGLSPPPPPSRPAAPPRVAVEPLLRPSGGASPSQPTAGPPPEPDGLPPLVLNTDRFEDLAPDYVACWAACRIRPEREAEVRKAVDRLLKGEDRYRDVSRRTGGVLWQLIGVMHGLECNYDFKLHLHNGDPLTAKTVRVPAGRPDPWDPRSPWEVSAVDAIRIKKLERILDWTLPQTLYVLEGFNGYGYRFKNRNVRSPYLWSFSNLWTKGKFVADGVFKADAPSKQVGAAVLLKELERRGLWP